MADRPSVLGLDRLSTGIHVLRKGQEWETADITPNASIVLGVSAEELKEQSGLWTSHVHPDDIDAVRAAFEGAQVDVEHAVNYRFRDARQRYRWVGYRFLRIDETSIVGTVSDVTGLRSMEYDLRLHEACRNALFTLLSRDDLSVAILAMLEGLGRAMAIDRAELIRFRVDEEGFLTHQWLRRNGDSASELPMAIHPEAAAWWRERLRPGEAVVVDDFETFETKADPAAIMAGRATRSVLAVPARINGVIEAVACFSVIEAPRRWSPQELETARLVVDGFARRVERRIEDRQQLAEELQLRRSEERYRTVARHSPVVLFGTDADGVFTLSEGQGLGAMGATPGEVVGHSVYEVYRNHPEVLAHVAAGMAGDEAHGTVTVGERVYELWITPVKGSDEAVQGLSGVSVDVTRRHELEKQQTFMMRELDHRVKNNIASILSLLDLSRSGAQDADALADALGGRLQALAIAHSTLAKTKWHGAWLRDVLQLTLQPYMQNNDGRISFDGSDVELPGMLARPMCMVVNELATNAAKHGALSNDVGTIHVTSELNEERNCVVVTWAESGGPPVVDTGHRGTGTTLLEGLVQHEMRGQLDISLPEDGLTCRLEVPLTGSGSA